MLKNKENNNIKIKIFSLKDSLNKLKIQIYKKNLVFLEISSLQKSCLIYNLTHLSHYLDLFDSKNNNQHKKPLKIDKKINILKLNYLLHFLNKKKLQEK